MSDPEIDRLRTELAEWRTKALDVEKHPVVAALRAELEAAKKERDEARGVEEYWKQHGEPIAAALRELAASRQSEERLRAGVVAADELLDNWGRPAPLCRRDQELLDIIAAALAAPAPASPFTDAQIKALLILSGAASEFAKTNPVLAASVERAIATLAGVVAAPAPSKENK